jgi:tetratricopeptide (TPR) repeat protein
VKSTKGCLKKLGEFMKKLFILLTILTFSSCSLLGEKEIGAEYSIHSSIAGANVYRPDGKIIGQTPLDLAWEDVKDFADGRFVSFIIEKPGYYTRVVFFDASESVNLKIDLNVDKDFKKNRVKIAELKLEHEKVKNSHLKEQNSLLKISLADLKKQLNQYNQNMLRLQARLESANIKIQELHEVTKVGGVNTKVLNLPMKTNFSVTRTPACKEVKQRKCPKVKVLKKFYPSKETNEIVRELLTAQMLIINKDYAKAKNYILGIEERYPRVAAVYTLLAYIEINQGNKKKAKFYIDKSLRLDRNDQMAKRMLTLLAQK